MAVVQTAATGHLIGISPVAQKDAAGFYYHTWGAIRIYVGAGTPEHAATLGSLCIDNTNGILYICTVISGTWATVGGINS
jgi:hypothetical protein